LGGPAQPEPLSYDEAQPFSGDPMGTEVMLPTSTSAWLLIEEEGVSERRYEIKRTPLSIGSSDDNDIVLQDKAASRHHAKIRVEGKKHFIYDLASTNGTKVNGRKVTKKWIKEGDSIEVGHTRMTFKPSETSGAKPSNLLKM
jgi:pSer/pThr/pTyr-binding forkhead associated (FHA) protein